MAEQCTNLWGKGKNRYKTRAQAEKALKGSHVGGLHIYQCKWCGGWHLTSQEPRNTVQPIPSAAKLRRKLEEARRQIAASERRLTTAERSYFEELRYVHRETERIMAGRVR